jgi:exopolysaccharide production protein ExoZ
MHGPRFQARDRGSGRLRSLQAGRGIAAFSVMMYHAVPATSVFVAPIPDWLTPVLSKGFLGVDFFFVLSGFIILNAHADDPPTGRALESYVFKRLNRIYIPYLPISLFLIGSYSLLPDLSRVEREWGWLTSLLLVPSFYPPALPVAWSLVHEMLFYSIFLVFFVNRKIFALVVFAWTATLFTVSPPNTGLAQPMIATLLNPINFEFVLGLGCAVGYRLLDPRYGIALVIAGVATMVTFFLGDQSQRLLFGFGAAMIILGAVLKEEQLGGLIPMGLVGLGDASYAIYMIHVPLMSLTSRFAARVVFLHNWPGALIFSLGCGVVVGCAYHYFFERPALAAIRRAGALRLATQPQT